MPALRVLQNGTTVELVGLAVEDDHQGDEDNDEGLLHGNTGGVDVETVLDVTGVVARAGHATTDGLGQEGRNVAPDKDLAHGGRLDYPHLLVWQEEVEHTGESHVDKGVDPQRGQEEKQVVGGGEALVLLVMGAERTHDEGAGLPERTHAEHPSKALPES